MTSVSKRQAEPEANVLFPHRDWVPAQLKESDPGTNEEKPGANKDKARRLVLCLDGTSNQFSYDNSNVLEFFKCLRKDDKRQLVYYQTGIGTYTKSTFVTKPVVLASMLADAAIGWNLEDHVEDAYRFLMQNYKAGDKVSLFGFSRGAYTARVLYGFIQKVGLLPPDNHAQIPFAWKVFMGSDINGGFEECARYKKAFSLPVEIDFLGVWDTVASIGISGKELPFDKPLNGKGLRVFRQALALDERRAKFIPNFKLTDDGTLSRSDFGTGEPQDPVLHARSREVWFAGCHSDVGGGSVPHTTRNSLARIPLRWMIRECFRMDTGIIFDKKMLAEIGFRSVPFRPEDKLRQEKQVKAADDAQSLIKAIQGFFLCKLIGYIFAALFWPAIRLFNLIRYSRQRHPKQGDLEGQHCVDNKGSTCSFEDSYKQRPNDSRKSDACTIDENGTEQDEERQDALSPIHDQLSMRWFWWILELWPIIFRLQNSQGGQRSQYETRFNLGKGRKIYGDAWNSTPKETEDTRRSKEDVEGAWWIEVHRSVLTRIEDKESRYRPRAWFSVLGKGKFHWKGLRPDSESDAESESELDPRSSEDSRGWHLIRWVD
ncbi:uncharacterized protein FOMMEDRAFT_31962 [Fomitiporia mediterranea MF3/22]|uniref:uncharacterized protein n=1 Tax=Fomitiporia mediterranea (strain MF3/22) TaxID=694068 RepID=UPI0004407C10|nr:uncharacterized protein FOMMEDRAFT_31962 [Fomitiporia mediterranea MF3/22]EJC98191.1 hypothetical protein FOMMEDRAFT_31962 [Fomitiporia mediterranea MF3/22]